MMSGWFLEVVATKQAEPTLTFGLDAVPWIVVCFAEKSTAMADGSKRKSYYVGESAGIACGFFISAVHRMGLAALTRTPNPMGFLNDICHRPATERPYILFPVGYPAADAEVPDLQRKTLTEVIVEIPGPGH
jgi:iodotyrosine deiodinase